MKERPILFSGEMVRAILEGRKTMTRRVIKPQPTVEILPAVLCPENVSIPFKGEYVVDGDHVITCPYGQPGDRLWVRETWAVGKCADALNPSALSQNIWMADNGGVWYEADETSPASPISPKGKIRPSIFMPRWASRILLEVVSVRVERVQDISEKDARAEGATATSFMDMHKCPMSLIGGLGSFIPSGPRYRFGFYELWDSINAKRGYGWDANPWVWVVEFKRLEATR